MVWNAIKGAIFEDDGSTPETKQPQAQPPQPTQGVPSSLTSAPQVIPTGVNEQFVAAIKQAVFSKSTALTSLVHAADSLKDIIPDQTTRFKAAFKTSGAGRTVQQITSAADIHLADIEGEELRFKAAVDAKLGNEIAQAEGRAQQAAQGIQSLQMQIEQLQRQMTEAQTRIGQLTQEQAEQQAVAQSKRTELELTSAQFKAAAAAVRNEIQALRQTVTTALS